MAALGEDAHQEFLLPLDAECQRLDNEEVSVAVDDETGDPVILSIDKSVRVGDLVEPEEVPCGECAVNAAFPERLVDRFLRVPGEEPDDDLGTAVEVSASEPFALAAVDIDDFAVLDASFQLGDRAGEDPRVVATYWTIVTRFQNETCVSHEVLALPWSGISQELGPPGEALRRVAAQPSDMSATREHQRDRRRWRARSSRSRPSVRQSGAAAQVLHAP